jgi:putative ubiquitin-RnfH superfamily antitoxin RatB of RatAB toxin-antitoxin module
MSVLRVEVVYALPERQVLRRVSLRQGSTVDDALRESGLLGEFPEIGSLRKGVFGRPVEADAPLRDRDRVEIYRPLRTDPKAARRVRATRARARR